MTVRRIIICALAPVVVYLLAAFIAWEFDPSAWDRLERSMAAALAVWLTWLVFTADDDAS